jgi:hypothetical protein
MDSCSESRIAAGALTVRIQNPPQMPGLTLLNRAFLFLIITAHNPWDVDVKCVIEMNLESSATFGL